MLSTAIGQAIGRSIGRGSGVESAAFQAGARAGTRVALRREHEWLGEQVRSAGDAGTAWRRLAAHWLRVQQQARELALRLDGPGLDVKTRQHTQAALMSRQAALAVMMAPIFDELPLRAAGLVRVDEAADPPAWRGTRDQVVQAASWMADRGLSYADDGDDRVELRRADAPVVALAVAADHVTPADQLATLPAAPKLTYVVFAWLGAGVVAMIAAGVTNSWLAFAIPLVAMLIATTALRVLRRRHARRAEQRAIVSSLGGRASAGPFRDQHAVERVPAAELLAALRDGGLTVTPARGRIQIADEDRAAVIEASAGAEVSLAALAITYRDPRVPVRAAFALASAFGPIAIEHGGARVTADPAAGYARWLDEHVRDRATIDELGAALERGLRAAMP